MFIRNLNNMSVSFIFILTFSMISIVITCPPGTIQGISNDCYKLFAYPADFFTAQETCVQSGGNLTSVHNGFTNAFLQQETQFLFIDSTDFWLGGDTVSNPGNWSWTDGTIFDYYNWAKGIFVLFYPWVDS